MAEGLRLENGVLAVPNRSHVTFPVPLVQLIDINDVIVVRGQGRERYYPGNIWGLSSEGALLWRVTESWPLDSEFVEMELINGKLIAFNFNGYRCVIDPWTGRLEERVFTK